MPIKLKDINPVVFNHNVGIGVDNPSTKLEVNGEVKCTTLTQTSDYRLKQNVSVMNNGLDKIMQLKVHTFNWKNDNLESVGFLAHEIQGIVPGSVYGEKDEMYEDINAPKYQSVNSNPIVAVLVAAVKELNLKVEALEQKLSKYEK